MPTANMSSTVSEMKVEIVMPSQTVTPQVQATLSAMVRMGQSTALKERNRIHSNMTKITTMSMPSKYN